MGVREDIREMLENNAASSLMPIREISGILVADSSLYVVPDTSTRGMSLGAGRIGYCCHCCGHLSDISVFEQNWFPQYTHSVRCINCGTRVTLYLRQPAEMYKMGAFNKDYATQKMCTAEDVKNAINRVFVLQTIVMFLRERGDDFREGPSTRETQERFDAFIRYNEVCDIDTDLHHWAKVLKVGFAGTDAARRIVKGLVENTKEFAPKSTRLLIGTRAHVVKNYAAPVGGILYTLMNTTNELTGRLMLFPIDLLPDAARAAILDVGGLLIGRKPVARAQGNAELAPVFSLVGAEVTCTRCGNIEIPEGSKKCTNCNARYNIFKTESAKRRAMKSYEARANAKTCTSATITEVEF